MELVNNKYQFAGGIDPLDLCKEYGTPLYVYDASVMERQYKRITGAFSYPKVHIHYACKALSNLTVMRLFRQWGAGLDCVSIQEVQLGLMAGYKPENILYTPNFAGLDEYDEAARLGVQFPVYVLVTKTDLLSGFSEYFLNYTREDRAQVWGFIMIPAPARMRPRPGRCTNAVATAVRPCRARWSGWPRRRCRPPRACRIGCRPTPVT